MNADPVRWGEAPRLTRRITAGQPGIPAVPLYRPFAGWVSRGWRRIKYLRMHPAAGDPTVYYLYSTAGFAPESDFYYDAEDIFDDFDVQDAERVARAADAELARRQKDPASLVESAIVGLGRLDQIEDNEEAARVWIFAGGALLPEPIPVKYLLGRPYGGVFYPFGKDDEAGAAPGREEP